MTNEQIEKATDEINEQISKNEDTLREAAGSTYEYQYALRKKLRRLHIIKAIVERQPTEDNLDKVKTLLSDYSTASGIEDCFHFDDETKEALDIIRESLGIEGDG